MSATLDHLPKQVQDAADEAARLEQTLQPEPSGQADPVPDPAPAPTPPAPVTRTEDPSWQQRYQTLQGMYNAEVPRMQAQVQDLSRQLQEVTARLNQPKPPVVPEAPKAKQVTDKDVEVFGGDLIDLIRRQSADLVQAEQDKLAAELNKLAAENAELKKQVGTVAEQQGQGQRYAYIQELTKRVPDWQALNVDPEFLKWLAEVDPMSGIARQAYITNAWDTLDVERTAVLFNAYKGNGATSQAAPDARAELARQVAPGSSKASANGAAENASEKIWTRAQIENFYTDVTKGLYSDAKGKAKAAQMELEIDAAVASGRVR